MPEYFNVELNLVMAVLIVFQTSSRTILAEN